MKKYYICPKHAEIFFLFPTNNQVFFWKRKLFGLVNMRRYCNLTIQSYF